MEKRDIDETLLESYIPAASPTRNSLNPVSSREHARFPSAVDERSTLGGNKKNGMFDCAHANKVNNCF